MIHNADLHRIYLGTLNPPSDEEEEMLPCSWKDTAEMMGLILAGCVAFLGAAFIIGATSFVAHGLGALAQWSIS